MKNARLYLLICIHCIWLSNVYAQPFTFEPMPYNDLLPSYTVQQVFQDKKGFIWFGTIDGLSRYDGYRLLTFRSNSNNRMLLSNNDITCLAEDAHNRLFIGTQKGLCYLNKTTYEIVYLNQALVALESIRFIKCTTKGDVWIGTSSKLLKFNADLTQCVDYSNKLLRACVNTIFEDQENNLWVLLWDKGIYRYNESNDSFISYPRIGKNNVPFTMIQDNQGRYWIGTWGEGLYLFNPKATKQDMFISIPCYDKAKKKSESVFFSMLQDDLFGYIWTVTQSGIYVFDVAADGKPVLNEDISFNNESNNVFSGIAKDKEGNLWVGSYNEGVYQIKLDLPTIRNYSLSTIKQLSGFTPNINMLFKDREGAIWFNQINWGMGIYSPINDKIKTFMDVACFKEIESIHCIKSWREHPDEIWIGAEGQNIIYRLHKKGTQIYIKNKVELSSIKDKTGMAHLLFEDSQNNKWIITQKTLILQYAKQDLFIPIAYDFGIVTGIAEDLKGNVWIGSDKGVFKTYLFKDKKVNPLDIKRLNNNSLPYCNNVTAIGVDKIGQLWIGTQEGSIFCHNISNETYTNLSSQICTLGESIQDVIPDDMGHMWFATNKRIMEFNPINRACREYSSEDGMLVNSFRRNSWIKDTNGEIYIGGNRGISIFTPSDHLSAMPKDQTAIVTEVMVNSKSVYSKSGDKFDINKQRVILEPDERNIELHFSALKYSNPLNIRFAYKIEGIDKEWIYPEENRRFAVYNQLKKGNHTFYIKASDENRLWNDHVTEFHIYKYPHWYESNVAYTCYGILFMVLSYVIYYFVRNKIHLQNSVRYAQIDKEKTEELTQMKLRYFTNISHDLLTPLTIMSCLMDDIQMTYPDKSERFLSMRFNLNRLKKLLQQVLDFRKIENGKMPLLLSEGDIVVFIQQSCYNYFIPLMEKKQIQFTLLATPQEINCYFDADKIEKAIFNLLSNSYKYTGRGGQVELSIASKKDNKVVIQITDTGIGIDEKELAFIFIPFHSNKRKENRDTNGIGLSVVKEMIEMHHGSIQVESGINKGTTFTISIPLDKESYKVCSSNSIQLIPLEEVSVFENYTPSRELIDAVASSDISSSILVVEDNEELLELMAGILEKEYKIIKARNGVEALRLVEARDSNVDLIISDVMMPQMDGLELCQAMKRNLEMSHIPIILLTARSTPEDRVECYKAGANGYISKPFELSVLKARITNFLIEQSSRKTRFVGDREINISTLSYQSLDKLFLEKAVRIIEEHLLDQELDVESISQQLNLSKSTFYRKIKMMTGLTPLDFIKNIQLKHACIMLEDPAINVSEVAYSIGFTDPKYFTKCFKSTFNITPSAYQKKQKENKR